MMEIINALQIFLIPAIVLSFASLLTFVCLRVIRRNQPALPKESKPYIKEFDFVRAVSALGISAFHFSFYLTNGHRLFARFFGVGWGDFFVTCFFLLSGATLAYNYPKIRTLSDLKVYYAKRLLGILPAYYLAFTWYYVAFAAKGRDYFYGGSLWKLLLTLVGLDGYFAPIQNNYYQIGEWFTGMILFLYLIYPLLMMALQKPGTTLAAWAVILCLYVHILYIDLDFPVSTWTNPVLCVVPFFLGMTLIRFHLYGKLRVKAIGAAMLVVSIIIMMIMEDSPYFLYYAVDHLFGISLFILLSWLGTYLMKIRGLSRLISAIGGISYGIFLVQHKVVTEVTGALLPASTTENVIFLPLALIIIVIEGSFLVYAQKKFTGFFRKIA